MGSIIAGFEVDLTWLIQVVMHKRGFKGTTTYPFLCMIFALCRSAVPVCHIDVIKTPPDHVHIALIGDEVNELAPNKRPHIELQPLGETLEAMVEQAQGDNPATS